MLLVLDTNQYIFGLGLARKSSCEKLITTIIDTSPRIRIRIPRIIVTEVRQNLSRESFQLFIEFINNFTSVDEDFLVPFEIGIRYETLGFKPSDALIGAYTEWVGAEILVSENRHFLSRQPNLPFKVLTADKCLNLITR